MSRKRKYPGAQRAPLIVNTRSRTGEKAFFRALDLLHSLDVTLGATYALRDPARLPETVRQAVAEGYDLIVLVLVCGAKCPFLRVKLLGAAPLSSFDLMPLAGLLASGQSASGCAPGCPNLPTSSSLPLRDRGINPARRRVRAR